jgi:hypothetical protein
LPPCSSQGPGPTRFFQKYSFDSSCLGSPPNTISHRASAPGRANHIGKSGKVAVTDGGLDKPLPSRIRHSGNDPQALSQYLPAFP